MPGMENLAPERTLTSSGFVDVAQLLPHALFERLQRFQHLLRRSPAGTWLLFWK